MELNAGIHSFCSAASRYCTLLETKPDDAEAWCEEMLRAIVELYASAVLMVDFDAVERDDATEKLLEVSDGEWRDVFDRIAATLGNRRYYQSTDWPLDTSVTTSELLVGDLADDLADIYRDVSPAARAMQHDAPHLMNNASYDAIKLLLPSHWGLHATEALRQLHIIAFLSGLRPS